MKVFGLATDSKDQWTTPYPTGLLGLKLRLLCGDVCDPYWFGNGGSWFKLPAPRWIVRFFSYIPLPYIAIGISKWGLYLGWKVYGVDSIAYRQWLSETEVYAGSQAMCFTIRMTLARQI